MTGEELLRCLQSMKPEERRLHVLVEGEDRYRNPCYFALSEVMVKKVDNGKVTDSGSDCICLDV